MIDRPKKVLVLTSTLPRWAGDTEPRFVEYLCYELARYFEVVVLAPRCPGAARDETLRHGGSSIRVHRFRYCFARCESLAYEGGIMARLRRNPLRLLLVPLFLIAQSISMRKLQRSYRFDAIHAHWIIPQGLVAIRAKKRASMKLPVLVTAHGGDLFGLRGFLMTRLKRSVLRDAERVSVVSNAMQKVALELGCDASRLTVQPMGVDLRSVFVPGDAPIERDGLVFVGRLVENKGVKFLVEAISRLVDHFPGITLTVIGDGPLRGELADLAGRHRVEKNIRFIGSVANVNLPDYLRRAKIAVMPSVIVASGEQEGLGLVAVEAMGCGCAVVASDLPTIRDTVIDGETGLMARPADAADLAAKIERLLNDADLLARLADNGRRHALQHFDWREVGDNYAAIIRGML